MDKSLNKLNIFAMKVMMWMSIISVIAGILIVAIPSVSAVWDSGLSSGLVAYYPLNDSTMNVVNPTQYNLSAGGSGTYASALIGNGLSNDYIYGRFNMSGLSTSSASSWSVCAWVSKANTGSQTCFGMDDSIDCNYGSGTCGEYEISHANSGTRWQIAINDWAIGTNTLDASPLGWRLICAVHNSTSFVVYWNNTVMENLGAGSSNARNIQEILLGAGKTDGSAKWQGLTDEVGIWNRTLSNTEISQLYNSGAGLTYAPTVADTTYPVFSSPLASPTNASNYVDGVTYQFNITIATTNGTAGLEFNGVNYTVSNYSSMFNSSHSTLSAGTYPYYWWAYGSGTNHLYNVSNAYYYTVNKTTPTLTFLANGGVVNLSGTYPQAVNISATTNLGILNLTRNGLDYLSHNSVFYNLSGGEHIFMANVTGNQNYSDVTNRYYNVTVNKKTLVFGSYLTTPIAYGNASNYNANVTIDLLEYCDKVLFRNGGYIMDGFAHDVAIPTFYVNDTEVLDVGSYSYNYSVTCQNYTSADLITVLDVNKAQSSAGMSISGTTPIGFPMITDVAGAETNTGDTGCSYNLDKTNQVYGVGTVTFNYSTVGCGNYEAGSLTKDIVITQNTTLALGISGTTPITYGTLTDVAGSGCPAELTCSLDKSNAVYGVGTQTFNYSTLGNQNYSGTSITKNIVINKGLLIGSLTSDSGWTVEAGKVVTINSTRNIEVTNSTSVLGVGTITSIANASDNQWNTFATTSTLTDYFIENWSLSENSSSISWKFRGGIDTCPQITGGQSVQVTGWCYNYTLNDYSLLYTTTQGCGNVTWSIPSQCIQENRNISTKIIYDNNFYGTEVMGYAESEIFYLNKSGDADVVYNIFKNGVDKTGGERWTSTLGTYVYILNSTGGQNYSENALIDTQTLIVQDTTKPLVKITYPTATAYSTNVSILNYTYYDIYPASCWYSRDGGTSNSSIVSAGTNFTGVTSTEVANTWIVYCNDSSNNQNSSSVTFSKDTVYPTFVLNSLADVQTTSLPANATLDVTTTDISLGTCIYSKDNYATNSTYTCNTPQIISFTTGGIKTIKVFANDTYGNSNSTSYSFNLYDFNITQQGALGSSDGSTDIFTLLINSTSFAIGDANAVLWFNGVNKGYTTKAVLDLNSILFTSEFAVPSGTGNITGKNILWNWSYDATHLSSRYTDTKNQTVFSGSVGDCETSGFGHVILNMSLKNEEDLIKLNTTAPNTETIEIDLDVTSRLNSSIFFSFSKKWINNDTVAVCVPNGFLNSSSYKIDFTVGYDGTDHVREFYYLENGTLDNTDMFNAYTNHSINLMDLLTVDSTTFLFTFTDQNNLEVPDAIVHTFRKYIGEGLFREVERSKQDNNGETHVHLVEEDVIYYFMVTQLGRIVYTSDTYNAKCLSTPCAISLSASPSETNWSIIYDEGGDYSVTADKTTRIVTTSFTLPSSSLVNVSIYKLTNGVTSLVNQSSLTAISGSIPLHVPLAYGNSTFFVAIYKNNAYIKSEWVDLTESAINYFGTFGAILGGLIILAIMLMAVSEGAGFIVFTVLALVVVAIMGLVDLGWMALISIICAGGIILWKLVTRRHKVG